MSDSDHVLVDRAELDALLAERNRLAADRTELLAIVKKEIQRLDAAHAKIARLNGELDTAHRAVITARAIRSSQKLEKTIAIEHDERGTKFMHIFTEGRR